MGRDAASERFLLTIVRTHSLSLSSKGNYQRRHRAVVLLSNSLLPLGGELEWNGTLAVQFILKI